MLSDASQPHGVERARGCIPCRLQDPCFVAAQPAASRAAREGGAKARGKGGLLAGITALAPQPRALGFEDGLIIPPDEFPAGTPSALIRAAAAERAPLRGAVRVIVVLVDFSDKKMQAATAHFEELFFSTGVLPHGSVKEYYAEATHGLVDITGDVVGPYRMPHTLNWYANRNFGINRRRSRVGRRGLATWPTMRGRRRSRRQLRALRQRRQRVRRRLHRGALRQRRRGDRQLGRHLVAQVDAAERLRDGRDEDLRLSDHPRGRQDRRLRPRARSSAVRLPGPLRHGRLLRGHRELVPDGGGSWNGGGDVPAHPSAWCKVNQGWAAVTNVTGTGRQDRRRQVEPRRPPPVEGRYRRPGVLPRREPSAHGLRRRPAGRRPADLAHRRQPIPQHRREPLQGRPDAGGRRRDLELNHNRGDEGDPYPGSAANTASRRPRRPTPTATPGRARACRSPRSRRPRQP